jgi:hypothetical protein
VLTAHGARGLNNRYGLLRLAEFAERNPGLLFENKSRADKLPVAFQPEIGSVSTPTAASLKRFFSLDALRRFPVQPRPGEEGEDEHNARKICPSFKGHFLSPRARTLALRFATFFHRPRRGTNSQW